MSIQLLWWDFEGLLLLLILNQIHIVWKLLLEVQEEQENASGYGVMRQGHVMVFG